MLEGVRALVAEMGHARLPEVLRSWLGAQDDNALDRILLEVRAHAKYARPEEM